MQNILRISLNVKSLLGFTAKVSCKGKFLLDINEVNAMVRAFHENTC
ncbi:MAG: hypothetical protein HOP34_09040 [Methylococcaceae bacterium]|nr:hypothetical protein [Methylococcaceae bacterium]